MCLSVTKPKGHSFTHLTLTTTNLQLPHYHALGNQRAWTTEEVHTIKVLMQTSEELGRMPNQYQ